MRRYNNFIDYLIIGCLIILMASASSLISLFFYIMCIVFLVILSIKRKAKLGSELLWVILFWFGINAVAFYFTGTKQTFNAVLGPLILIIIPYFALKVIGKSFWTRFEEVVYYLVLIDLVFYVLSNLFPSLFLSLYSIFRPWTNDAFYEFSAVEGEYWYSYVFTFTQTPYRNSGFMWEPGAYGLVLVLIVLYRWSINGMKIGKREFVYIISIISTLSTAAFLALGVLCTWFIFRIRISFLVILIPIYIYACIWVSDLPFMGDKIDEFAYQTQVYDFGSNEERPQANRILSFFIALEEISHLPTGYGCTPSASFTPIFDEVAVVNGLGDLLTTWGVVGFIIIIVLIYRFWQISYKRKLFAFVATVSFIILLFSNPISYNPILWLVVWSSLIYNKTPVKLGEDSHSFIDKRLSVSHCQ